MWMETETGIFIGEVYSIDIFQTSFAIILISPDLTSILTQFPFQRVDLAQINVLTRIKDLKLFLKLSFVISEITLLH